MCIITVMKMIREIKTDELNKLLELYTHLHELGVPEHSEHLEKTWNAICNDENHHIIKTTIEITVEKDGKDESIYLFSRRKSQSIDDEL